MTGYEEGPVTERTIQEVAALAELPLDDDRAASILPLVRSLHEGANRLNRFMERRREVGPLVQVPLPSVTEGPE